MVSFYSTDDERDDGAVLLSDDEEFDVRRADDLSVQGPTAEQLFERELRAAAEARLARLGRRGQWQEEGGEEGGEEGDRGEEGGMDAVDEALAGVLRGVFPGHGDQSRLVSLPGDCLERIAVLLPSESALALLSSCKAVFYILARRRRLWQAQLEASVPEMYRARSQLRGTAPGKRGALGALIGMMNKTRCYYCKKKSLVVQGHRPVCAVHLRSPRTFLLYRLLGEHYGGLGIPLTRLRQLPKASIVQRTAQGYPVRSRIADSPYCVEDIEWHLSKDKTLVAMMDTFAEKRRKKADDDVRRRLRKRRRLLNALDGDETALRHPLAKALIHGEISAQNHFPRVVEVLAGRHELHARWRSLLTELSEATCAEELTSVTYNNLQTMRVTWDEAERQMRELDQRILLSTDVVKDLSEEELAEISERPPSWARGAGDAVADFNSGAISKTDFEHIVQHAKIVLAERGKARAAIEALADPVKALISMEDIEHYFATADFRRNADPAWEALLENAKSRAEKRVCADGHLRELTEAQKEHVRGDRVNFIVKDPKSNVASVERYFANIRQASREFDESIVTYQELNHAVRAAFDAAYPGRRMMRGSFDRGQFNVALDRARRSVERRQALDTAIAGLTPAQQACLDNNAIAEYTRWSNPNHFAYPRRQMHTVESIINAAISKCARQSRARAHHAAMLPLARQYVTVGTIMEAMRTNGNIPELIRRVEDSARDLDELVRLGRGLRDPDEHHVQRYFHALIRDARDKVTNRAHVISALRAGRVLAAAAPELRQLVHEHLAWGQSVASFVSPRSALLLINLCSEIADGQAAGLDVPVIIELCRNESATVAAFTGYRDGTREDRQAELDDFLQGEDRSLVPAQVEAFLAGTMTAAEFVPFYSLLHSPAHAARYAAVVAIGPDAVREENKDAWVIGTLKDENQLWAEGRRTTNSLRLFVTAASTRFRQLTSMEFDQRLVDNYVGGDRFSRDGVAQGISFLMRNAHPPANAVL